MDRLFTTTALLGIVNSLIRPNRWILDKFFPNLVTFDTAEVTFDIELRRRRVAAFAAPMSEGRVVLEQGYDTQTFSPAYIKEITPLTPLTSFKRAIGETIGGGELTPMQRQELRIVQILADQTDAIIRRKVLMGVEALVHGRNTVEGEGYPRKVVQFRRSAGLKLDLAGSDKWSEPGSNPVADLQRWMHLVHKTEGAVVTDAVLDPDAFEAAWTNEEFRKALDNRNMIVSADGIQVGPTLSEDGVTFKGMIGSLAVWVYSDYYEDPVTKAVLPFLDSGRVLLASAQVEGSQLQGAIIDEDANLQAFEFFPKSWPQPNPSLRMIMTQSAPLVVPKRPNATFSAKVL